MSTKKFFQILAVSATALITACEEQLTSFDGQMPITVTTRVSENTRAGYDNANLPDKFVMNIDQDGTDYDYTLVEMSHQGSGSYKASDNLFWKGSDHSNVQIKALTIPNGLNAINPTSNMTINISTVQTSDELVKANDLLGAKTNDGIEIKGNNIEIEFRHLMSKLEVTYLFGDALTGKNPTVNSITLNNTCVQGGYSYSNMDYVNSSSSLRYGNIQMLHTSGNKTAEAIFYPYTPTTTTGNPELAINITINGTAKTLTCPVELKSNTSFEGRKKYIMTVRINGSTAANASVIVVKDWIEDEETIGVDFSDKKILWIGTSIPSNHSDFGGRDSYPTMIAKATGCTIINKAEAGSLVSFFPNPAKTSWTDATKWTSANDLDVGEAEAYALAATPEEIKTKYTEVLTNLARTKFPKWNSTSNYGDAPTQRTNYQQYISAIPMHIERLQQYSYVNLILPYVNGEKAKCDVVVIDHIYNDRGEAHMEAFKGGKVNLNAALTWLEEVGKGNYGTSENFVPNTDYVQWCYQNNYITSTQNVNPKISYIAAMNHVINECKAAAASVGNNVQIIIGNYFATRSTVFGPNVVDGTTIDFAYIGDCIVKINEAVAALNGLPIVNVYEHTGLNATNVSNPYFYQVFLGLCPDGVHPGSDPTGTLNKIIADIYIEEFKKIFSE